MLVPNFLDPQAHSQGRYLGVEPSHSGASTISIEVLRVRASVALYQLVSMCSAVDRVRIIGVESSEI